MCVCVRAVTFTRYSLVCMCSSYLSHTDTHKRLPKFFILSCEHFSHFILRVIFFVTLAFLWNTGLV